MKVRGSSTNDDAMLKNSRARSPSLAWGFVGAIAESLTYERGIILRGMALSLKQTQAVTDLAAVLYPFLPGKPHPFGDQRLSFPAIARDLGVGGLWSGGSKQPAITHLLTGVLESRPELFCWLILEVVRRGMVYRRDSPVTQEDIDELNVLVLGVGFKIPELHDREFITALPRRDGGQAPPPPAVDAPVEPARLAELEGQLRALMPLASQQRGYAFERFLNELFHAFGLAPRGSFRLQGEQIDGSFQFHGDTYLVEARWQDAVVDQAGLGGLHLKVEGKAAWSRGLFVSWSGFSNDGLDAYARGKRTHVICMVGLELWQIVQGKLDLRRVIEAKARRAAEANVAFAPVRDLFPNVP